MSNVRHHVLIIAAILLASCGSMGESPLEDVVDKPASSAGRQAINDNNWEAAITAFKALVDAGSTDYTNHLGLAVAYAGSVCVEILDAILNPEGENSDCVISVPADLVTGDEPLDMINRKIARLQLAVEVLALIPDEARQDPAITSSFAIHFALFNLIAAQAIQEKYTKLSTVTIEDLSAEDADALIAFLEAGGSIESVPGMEGMSEGIQEKLAQVQNMPGETNQEKVQNYLNQQNGGGGGGS